MSTRRAWSLVVYALVGALVLYLWFDDDQGASEVGAGDAAQGVRSAPPMLETVERPKAATPDPQATAHASKAREAYQYRVYTNVAGATVTLHVSTVGKEDAPAPITKTADSDGFAGFEIAAFDAPLPLVEAAVEAVGYRAMRRRLVNGVVRMKLNRGHAVRGHVFGADGKPLKGATLRLDGVATRSRADGSFTAYANKTGNLRLAAGHRAHLRGHVFVEAPSQGVDVKLARGAEVQGRVTFPDGTPVPGVRVRVYASLCYAVTRANGTYTIRGLVPGRAFRLGIVGRWHFFSADTRTADLVVHDHVVHFTFRSPSGKTARDIYITSGYERENGVESRAWGWARNGKFMARTPVNSTVIYAWTAPHIEMGTRRLITDNQPRVYYLQEALQPLRAHGRLAVVRRDEHEHMRHPEPHWPPRPRLHGGRMPRLDVVMPTGAKMIGFDNLRFEPDEEGRMVLDDPLPPGRYGVELAGSPMEWVDVLPDETTEVVFR